MCVNLPPTNEKRSLRAGEVARLAGVSIHTVRHYEKVGVLPRAARTEKGYRIFPPETFQRVLLVRSAIQAGFSLKELARVLRERDSGGAPCREVHALAKTKLARVREHISALQSLENLLRARIASWEKRLARTRRGVPARLLDDLAVAFAESKSKRGKK